MKPVDEPLPFENEESKLPAQPAPEPDCSPGNTETDEAPAQEEQKPNPGQEFRSRITQLAIRIEATIPEVAAQHKSPIFKDDRVSTILLSELHANLQLAQRQLEVAHMWLLKALAYAGEE